jgi:UDP-N-acetyl-2-amino-2-deoxyglucuronate dehydrogenase
MAPWTADAIATIEIVRPRPRGHYLSEPWRLDPDASGGGHVAHLAVHHLDLACQLLGVPARVAGLTDRRDVSGIETRAALGVHFVGGALLSVLTSAHPGRRSERLHVVDGDRDIDTCKIRPQPRIGETGWDASGFWYQPRTRTM